MTKAVPMSDKAIRIMGYSKKIAVKNTAANLKTILDSLINAIKLITVSVPALGTSGTPINFTSFDTVKAQIALLIDEGTP